MDPVRPAAPDVLPSTATPVDKALLLLRHAGIEPPPGDPNSDAWLTALVDALCELSSRDPLTGLANRRSFELTLVRELDRVARSGEPALVLVIDIDHFKAVNDRHGHAAGDQVLQAVASTLGASVRPMDTVARYGGEEFAVVLPNCPVAFGPTVAERVRSRVQGAAIRIAADETIQVTVSIGGAFAPQWVRSSSALWIERADRQLYRAKSEGRNRVCLEPTMAIPVSAEEKQLLFGVTNLQDLE